MMSLSPKSQVMFVSAFSLIGDFFPYFWDSYFLSYDEFKMHEIKLRMQALRPAIASGTRGALPLVGMAS